MIIYPVNEIQLFVRHFKLRECSENNFIDSLFVVDNAAPKASAPTGTEDVTTSWQLALVTAPRSSENNVTSSKLVCN